jgi:hypothetical protein
MPHGLNDMSGALRIQGDRPAAIRHAEDRQDGILPGYRLVDGGGLKHIPAHYPQPVVTHREGLRVPRECRHRMSLREGLAGHEPARRAVRPEHDDLQGAPSSPIRLLSVSRAARFTVSGEDHFAISAAGTAPEE